MSAYVASKATAVAMALAVAITAMAPSSAVAALREEKKIGQFGSPIEWKAECVDWAIFHVPEIHNWTVKMVERRECKGHAFKNLQHEFFLVANGPDLDQAAKQVLQEALGVAVSAAVGTGLLASSATPAAGIAAAVGAAKTAFVGYLAARGLERLASQYDVRIDHRTSW